MIRPSRALIDLAALGAVLSSGCGTTRVANTAGVDGETGGSTVAGGDRRNVDLTGLPFPMTAARDASPM
jgi:hypothetical protein